MQHLPESAIFDGVGKISQTFTVVAATDIATATAHGLSNGDCVQVSSATTLPAGLSASTNYYVTVLSTDTFKFSLTKGGAFIDITDTGTGAHTAVLKGRTRLVEGFRHIELHMDTAGTATMTSKIQGSQQETMPDFNAAQSGTNRWDYIEIKDLNDHTTATGDTGVAQVGADDHRVFEVNTNALRWINVAITSWTQGTIRWGVTAVND
jgi:hypothetical protein